MSKMTFGRYNGNSNSGTGNGLHKDVLLSEAIQQGFKGLQKATKQELVDLLYGERSEEEDKILYKQIKDRIKGGTKKDVENTNILEMGLSEADLKNIKEVNSFQHGKIGRYYNIHFNSDYPEVNLIDNKIRYDEDGIERYYSPSKKELKWCEEKKKDLIDYINKEYNMNWNDYDDILNWIGYNDSELAPRNKKNVDYILSTYKKDDELDLNGNNNNDIVINKCLIFVPSN